MKNPIATEINMPILYKLQSTKFGLAGIATGLLLYGAISSFEWVAIAVTYMITNVLEKYLTLEAK